MKKIISLLLVFILLFSLFACNTEPPPEVTVYNLTINSSAEEFRTVMESQGFEVEQYNTHLIATKDFFEIHLLINEELSLHTSPFYK